MRPISYLFNILIVGFWILMMGLLVVKEFLPVTISPIEIRLPEELPYIENWGIYANNERIGYSEIKITEWLQGEHVQAHKEGGYIWEGLTELKMPLAEEVIPVSIISLVLFDNKALLKDFNIKMHVYDFGLNIEGKVVNDQLMLLCRTDGSEVKYNLPWSGGRDIINNGLFPWFYRPSLRIGERLQWILFNPLTQNNELVKAVVERSTLYPRKGDFIEVLVVAVWYQNTRMEFWIDKNGYPLRVNTPWGWQLVTE